MNAKIKSVLARIEGLEKDIKIANEYLATGEHANSEGFRPWFVTKIKDGKELPPHKDWVRNVYIRRAERSLKDAQKALTRLEAKYGTSTTPGI